MDSYKHNHVNFSHSCVNTHIRKLHVHIEQHYYNVDQYEVVDITNGGVEILEAPSRGGVWHIERCPQPCMSSVQHCKKPLIVLVLQG
jgi:hypothetical protein